MIDFTTLTCCSKSNTIIEFHAILYTNILKYTHCAIASFINFCFVFSMGIGMQRIRKMWKLLWTVINQNCQSVSHITDVDGLNIDQKTKEKCKNSVKMRIRVEWKQQNGTHIYRATVSNWSYIDCLEKHLSPDHIQTWWPFRDCDYWNALECALHTQTHTKEEEKKHHSPHWIFIDFLLSLFPNEIKFDLRLARRHRPIPSDIASIQILAKRFAQC